MSVNIGEVLNRRGDLSTFVVHLTRDGDGMTAPQKLKTIIREQILRARTLMGWASPEHSPDDPMKQSQRVVSFSEVPLEHIYSLVADIAGRQVALRPYGLALTKIKARKLDVNPVWYVDCTPGRPWKLALALDALRDQAKKTKNFHGTNAAKILPFIDRMGTWEGRRREFWWEREWRHIGNLSLSSPHTVTLWLRPESEIEDFRSEMGETGFPDAATARFIDPRWGLERIIAHLAGETEVSPFDAH
jgi:Putative abortive phage resistance protein AbiGi, antitoxin